MWWPRGLCVHWGRPGTLTASSGQSHLYLSIFIRFVLRTYICPLLYPVVPPKLSSPARAYLVVLLHTYARMCTMYSSSPPSSLLPSSLLSPFPACRLSTVLEQRCREEVIPDAALSGLQQVARWCGQKIRCGFLLRTSPPQPALGSPHALHYFLHLETQYQPVFGCSLSGPGRELTQRRAARQDTTLTS